MDNQHRKISGYRELSQAEIDLMNEIKALGPLIEEVTRKVKSHLAAQRVNVATRASAVAEKERLDAAEPERWLALGRTHAQESLMALTRAVAQPTFF